MPWRNGQGSTTEIVVCPAGSTLDEFLWRLSIADVAASGPFSLFPGYDRILVQIEGSPMTLSQEGIGERRLALLGPYSFGGEVPTYCRLDTPSRDFNVMVRRGHASAELFVHRLAKTEKIESLAGAETVAIHVLDGAVSVRVRNEHCAALRAETLVVTEVTPPVSIVAIEHDTVILLIGIAKLVRNSDPLRA
jgi:environmental stress-induced protein Ves